MLQKPILYGVQGLKYIFLFSLTGVDRELRKYIDYDKLFEEVICETDFYKDNVYDQKFNMNFVDKNVYDEYLKNEHETLIQETQGNELEVEIKM